MPLASESHELRCPGGHLHGQTAGRYLRRKCQQCSRAQGRPVFHLWDTHTWEIVENDLT